MVEEIPGATVANEQIRKTVVVEITPGAAGGITAIRRNEAEGDFGERGVHGQHRYRAGGGATVVGHEGRVTTHLRHIKGIYTECIVGHATALRRLECQGNNYVTARVGRVTRRTGSGRKTGVTNAGAPYSSSAWRARLARSGRSGDRRSGCRGSGPWRWCPDAPERKRFSEAGRPAGRAFRDKRD